MLNKEQEWYEFRVICYHNNKGFLPNNALTSTLSDERGTPLILAPKKKIYEVWKFKTILSVVSSTSLAYTRPCLRETKKKF